MDLMTKSAAAMFQRDRKLVITDNQTWKEEEENIIIFSPLDLLPNM